MALAERHRRCGNEKGEVVFREHGYNRSAESLRDEDFEKGRKSLRDMKVEPVPASGTESFRILFFRDDLPPLSGFGPRALRAIEGGSRSL